jgi:F-type H+-transporting ATPase subunit b
MEHAGLLQDTHFWVLVASIIFAGIAFRLGRGPALKMLDDRTERIRTKLEEAERLKEEAQELLADYQKKHRDAIQSAQKILDAAKETAARLQREAQGQIEETMERRESQLLDRIARAEAAAVTNIRHQAADIAAATAAKIIEDMLAQKGSKLVDEAIRDLPARLH